ncbi:hypothetical protein [Plantactinospora endophytica]|uniref:Uncharacterized protein n=1 Tax=Plantactinospora endophytica TaxID=673535 RepID=A0ABQ4E573_9ACTN|nr:hypothetical protein [Plantactinospora endophytica]GIG89476.1 hypothetical protein Pen02_44120 [Plantactinospora endophytica]
MSGSSASIFDLLEDEEEQAPTDAPRRGGVRGWLRIGFAAAGFAAAVVLGLRMVGIGVSAPAVFAGFLALLLLRRLARSLAPPPPVPIRLQRPADRGEEDGSYDWTVRDALGSSVSRWETKLAWSQGEPERFSRAVQPVLGELVDEVLRQRHGVDRATDPERARALLGEPLWNFIDTPPKRTPAPRDIAAIVAQLEKL